MTRRTSLPLLALLMVASCASPTTAPSTSKPPSAGASATGKATPQSPQPTAAASAPPSVTGGIATGIAAPRTITAIAGTVTAPATLVAGGGVNLIGADGATMVAAGAGNIVAAGGGNIVAAGAGNIVAAGAGNIVAAGAGNYRLAQASPPAFKPVARARVYLTSGDAVLPIAPVETDDQGNYRFPKVPSGVTYQVVVSIITPTGKVGRLASLVRPDATGAVADISPITTMVCAAVVGQKKGLGDVGSAGFKAATEEIGKLVAGQTGAGIDLGNPAGLPAIVETLVGSSGTAKEALATLKSSVETAPQGADEVAKLIQDLAVSTCAAADVVAAPAPGGADELPAAPSAIAVADDDMVFLGDRERRRVVVLKSGKFDRTIDGVEPLSLAVAAGALYVGDADSGKVLRIAADGSRTELAADQPYEPTAIAVAADGTVYFADGMRHAIFAVQAAGGVPTSLVGGKPGYADGAGSAARLYRPSGLALVGNALFVADAGNRRVRRIELGATASISAFAGSGAAGNLDGAGTAARFGYPAAIAADGTGTLWVADAAVGTIRRISATGVVETALNGGCVLDAKGLTYGGGLTFARFALWVIDGDRVVRRPVGPQPSASPATAQAASPSPAASPSGEPTASPSAAPTASPAASPTSSPAS